MSYDKRFILPARLLEHDIYVGIVEVRCVDKCAETCLNSVSISLTRDGLFSDIVNINNIMDQQVRPPNVKQWHFPILKT